MPSQDPRAFLRAAVASVDSPYRARDRDRPARLEAQITDGGGVASTEAWMRRYRLQRTGPSRAVGIRRALQGAILPPFRAALNPWKSPRVPWGRTRAHERCIAMLPHRQHAACGYAAPPPRRVPVPREISNMSLTPPASVTDPARDMPARGRNCRTRSAFPVRHRAHLPGLRDSRAGRPPEPPAWS